MSLENYFSTLIQKVEASDIQNNGKDKNGFFEPTRAMLLQRLNLLKDLHGKPNAKAMVQAAWQYVTEHLPPEWLILKPDEKSELLNIISPSRS
jgi:hypothetical protein